MRERRGEGVTFSHMDTHSATFHFWSHPKNTEAADKSKQSDDVGKGGRQKTSSSNQKPGVEKKDKAWRVHREDREKKKSIRAAGI